VQREPVERRAQRFVVGQSLRLEGREAAHPLWPGRRRLARDRRSRELTFGVALTVRLALGLEGPELAAPAKVSLHAPDQTLQHLPYFAGPEMAEPLPGELTLLLAPGAIERDQVKVRIESQVGRCPLHGGDRAALGSGTTVPPASGVERQHRLHDHAREPAQQCSVLGQPPPPWEREGQHPLAKPALRRQYPLHQVRGRRVHPPTRARRTEATALTTERHQPPLPAVLAFQARKTAAEQAAIEVSLQLLAGVLGDPHRDRTIPDRSGGRLFKLPNEAALPHVLDEIVADLRGQYVLGFAPTGSGPAGRLRKLTVKVPGHGKVVIRHRVGYRLDEP
jgi:hypothetical protein